MALSSTGKPSNQLTFTLTETYSTTYASNITGRGSNTASRTTVGGNILTFSHGNATGQINYGAQYTGVLPSGGSVVFDFTAFPTEDFSLVGSANFSSGIKSIIIANTWKGPNNAGFPSGFLSSGLASLCIAATGLNGFSGLFNGESGNVKVGPYGSWAITNFAGILPSSNNKEITLIDCDGSGVSYELTFVGVTGT